MNKRNKKCSNYFRELKDSRILKKKNLSRLDVFFYFGLKIEIMQIYFQGIINNRPEHWRFFKIKTSGPINIKIQRSLSLRVIQESNCNDRRDNTVLSSYFI